MNEKRNIIARDFILQENYFLLKYIKHYIFFTPLCKLIWSSGLYNRYCRIMLKTGRTRDRYYLLASKREEG